MDLYKHRFPEAVLKQDIDRMAAEHHRRRDELTAYLGHENLKRVEMCPDVMTLESQDQLLLATRAVYQALPPLVIEQLLQQQKAEKRLAGLEAAWADTRGKADGKAAVILGRDFK